MTNIIELVGGIIGRIIFISIVPGLIILTLKGFHHPNKFIIKECLLYPLLNYFFLLHIPILTVYYITLVTPSSMYENYWFQQGDVTLRVFIMSCALLGFISYCTIMKKLNKNIGLVDIYVYIYTYVQTFLFMAGKSSIGIDEKKNIVLLIIIFYCLNILCFYVFKREKIWKIIIMPTIVSYACIPFVSMSILLIIPW